jgi:predicted nucleic acid-binding protein
MHKKLIDTNIFIDRLANPDCFADIFTSDGVVYLSSVVLLELRAGAHTPSDVKAVDAIEHFLKVLAELLRPNMLIIDLQARFLPGSNAKRDMT